jgi:lipoate-protein ligase A
VTRQRASAAELHHRRLEPRRIVVVCDADAPAVVLGSAEPWEHVRADGPLPAIRRRSGGGAVLVGPGNPLWVDVIVPRGDPLWDDDVGRAAWWLGDAWVRALVAVGVDGADAHRAAMTRPPWSDRICFAGLGPGEVTRSTRKLVGIAQRRTRELALFQCAVPIVWDVDPLLNVLELTDEERAAASTALADRSGLPAGVGLEPLLAAFISALPDHWTGH